MKRVKRILIYLTCFIVLLSSFVFNSSAVEYDPYTEEEMQYSPDENAYYSIYKPFEFEPIDFFRLSSPRYKDFDINKLPWLEMPSYVQEIMSAEPKGLTKDTSYSGTYKLPFISVIVTSSGIEVIAGYNLCVGTYFQTSTQKENQQPYRTFLVSFKTPALYNNSVCYKATYSKSNYSLTSAWSALSATAVGDNFIRYYDLGYTVATNDYYFYGSSGMLAGRTLQTTCIYNSDDDMFPQYVTVNDPSSGFASGTITFLPDVWSGYVSTFTPPTAESLQQSTSKGILDTLKQIPTNIANSISSFFTNLGDRINVFFTNLSDNISGYFTTLRNYLLYFQADKPEHVNPFENILSDIQTFFNEQMSDVSDFKSSMNSSLNNIISYISSGSDVVNTFLTAVPLVSAFVTFFVVFCIVRKVVGR